MSEMIEKAIAAFVIAAAKIERGTQLDSLTPDEERALVVAVVKAMREPSFPMVKAMFNTKDDGGGSLHERKWQAAIDAALVGEG